MHLAEFLALMCAGLFAGAAVYINLAEHPARMGRDTRVALEVWGPSYARATRMQAPLALVALACGAVAWWLGAGVSWLVAGLLIGAVVPFTLAVMMVVPAETPVASPRVPAALLIVAKPVSEETHVAAFVRF